MTDDIEQADDELLLEEEVDDDLDGGGDEEGAGPAIGFSDDEEEDEIPLVKQLRDQIRERDRKLAKLRRSPAAAANDDPEPEVPDRPRSVAEFDYDEDRFNSAIDAHLEAKEAHRDWKARQDDRERRRQSSEEESGKRIEQQKNALGVKDYDAQATTVREMFTDGQLSVLIQGADNPAQMIYALGRSPTRLALLAGEENLARFAVMVGRMEKEIKVTKKTAPAPESRVRGATAPLAVTSSDKRLEALEKEAVRTKDRSKVIAYKAAQKDRAA